MRAQFNPAFSITVGLEGEYSNNPNDPGGPTKWGITEVEARDHGYVGDMKDLPIELAQLIYRVEYWNKLGLDSCEDQSIANELFDSAVNCGVPTVSGWAQEALNALGKADGNHEPLWPLLKIDRHFGPVSMAALNACLAISPHYTLVLKETLNCLQGASYVHDTEANPHLREFFLGWISNRVEL